VIYNPCTGGGNDGLEGHNVNLNQGAESTVSYLMARLTVDSAYNDTDRSKRKLNLKNTFTSTPKSNRRAKLTVF